MKQKQKNLNHISYKDNLNQKRKIIIYTLHVQNNMSNNKKIDFIIDRINEIICTF